MIQAVPSVHQSNQLSCDQQRACVQDHSAVFFVPFPLLSAPLAVSEAQVDQLTQKACMINIFCCEKLSLNSNVADFSAQRPQITPHNKNNELIKAIDDVKKLSLAIQAISAQLTLNLFTVTEH